MAWARSPLLRPCLPARAPRNWSGATAANAKSQLVAAGQQQRKPRPSCSNTAGPAGAPVLLRDGTVSGRQDRTYEGRRRDPGCPADTFFTSVFSAPRGTAAVGVQERGNQTLLADLLGLEQVRQQGHHWRTSSSSSRPAWLGPCELAQARTMRQSARRSLASSTGASQALLALATASRTSTATRVRTPRKKLATVTAEHTAAPPKRSSPPGARRRNRAGGEGTMRRPAAVPGAAALSAARNKPPAADRRAMPGARSAAGAVVKRHRGADAGNNCAETSSATCRVLRGVSWPSADAIVGPAPDTRRRCWSRPRRRLWRGDASRFDRPRGRSRSRCGQADLQRQLRPDLVMCRAGMDIQGSASCSVTLACRRGRYCHRRTRRSPVWSRRSGLPCREIADTETAGAHCPLKAQLRNQAEQILRDRRTAPTRHRGSCCARAGTR